MARASAGAGAARSDVTADVTAIPVHLVRGDDASLVRDAVARLVDELVGEGDRMLMVDDLSGDDYSIAGLVDAAQTPPFLTDRRVVVGRSLHKFGADELAPLVAYLGDPLPTTSLVLVWESGRVPKALVDAVKAVGRSVDSSPGWGGREQAQWLDAQLAASGVRLDKAARDHMLRWLGEDLARAHPVLETVAATFGSGATLGVDDIAPYLGSAGSVATWDLTDAIDRGDIGGALDSLHRMVGGDRHPLQILGTLTSHYVRMLRLDGRDITSDEEAAAVLGVKAFPAQKARRQADKLGHAKVTRAIGLLAEADLDLKGARDWPEPLVLEVLVARLAQQSKGSG